MTDLNELLDRARDHQLTRLPSGTSLHMDGCPGCAALSTLRSEVEAKDARIKELEKEIAERQVNLDGWADRAEAAEARIKELEALVVRQDTNLNFGALYVAECGKSDRYEKALYVAECGKSDRYEKALREIAAKPQHESQLWEHGLEREAATHSLLWDCVRIARQALTPEHRICSDCGAEEGAAYPPDTEEGRHRDHRFVPKMHGTH